MMFDSLREANIERQKEYDPDGNKFSILYFSNALAGEVGEACNVVKKLEREKLGSFGTRATPADLASELADVVIYADLLATKLGFNLNRVVAQKFNHSSEKLGLRTRMRVPD